MVDTVSLHSDLFPLIRSKRVVASVKADHVSAPSLDWLANNEAAAVQAVLSVISSVLHAFQRDEVVQLQLLIF